MTKSILKSMLAGAAFVASSFLTNTVIAQNGAINSAEFFILPENANYEKALEKIRQATFHDKTKDNAKTWYVRAKVFTAIIQVGNEDEKVAALVTNPADSAFASISKVKEMEKANGEDKYTKMIESASNGKEELDAQQILQNQSKLENQLKGAVLNQVVKYQETDFEKSYDLMLPLVNYFKGDTSMLSNVIYFATKAEKFDKAATYSEQLGDIEEYTDGLASYQSAAYSYYKLQDSTNFLRILEKGAERYPKEPYFLTNIADVYIQKKDYPKAIEILKKVNEIEPNTKNLTNIALMYQSEKQPEKAVEYYKKVLELDAQDYDATFALAVHYYRQAANVYNTLQGNDQEATNPKMKPVIESADQSIIYAKKAIEINSEDITLYNMLKDLYVMKEDTKNIELMKKKIEENK
jgi:tetratricopeptide (TPR) repeat protein